MVNHFEEALARMSDAEFQTMWEEIQQESEEGPTAIQLITDFTRSIAKINISFSWQGSEEEEFAFADEYNYAMAAWAR